MARTGDKVHWHHEITVINGTPQIFAIPLVRRTTGTRAIAPNAEIGALDGCILFDPHAMKIKDGGIKASDTSQIDFNRRADPLGLMSPGKTRGCSAEMAV